MQSDLDQHCPQKLGSSSVKKDFRDYECHFCVDFLFPSEDDDMDDKPEMEKLSLSESVKHYESDDDITEEYGGDFDISSKFNEDGSFIGLYGDKKSKTAGSKEATV